MASKEMTCEEFAKRIKEKGYKYDPERGHIYSPRGKLASKLTRNGYYTIARQFAGVVYTFCEHRVIWAMEKGNIPEDMVINHVDFDRGNNRLENLELVTQGQNMQHSADAGRLKSPKGEKGKNAALTDKEAQLIKWLCANGWKRSEVERLFNMEHRNIIPRVVTGARYGHVQDAASVMAVYPCLVRKTMNHALPVDEQMKNAVMGLCGESGEVIDIAKKHFMQGHDLDVSSMIDELGDVLYYCTLLMNLLDVDMADAMFANMDKLCQRYPDGFDVDKSVNRGDDL